MLLVHQAGSVKIGEVVRYTLTYTPSNDRILPTPSHLHLKIKNSSAIPLRAAWIHGPYALHVSAYPSTFNPHQKVEEPKRYGTPDYEPMLKAAGSWQTKLVVPDGIRETGADLGRRAHTSHSERHGDSDDNRSATWVIEIASQILFSSSASVDFAMLVGRDERSLDLGFAAVAGHGHGGPGQIKDVGKERKRRRRHSSNQTAGVYSKAVRLVAEDTDALWDKPRLPTLDDETEQSSGRKSKDSESHNERRRKRKKIHLVVLTHGLHSNIGADMLFLKESIDATVKQARLDAKKRKASYRAESHKQKSRDADKDNTKDDAGKPQADETATAPLSGGQEELDSDDEEETIVRGFSGNAVRTENGIQYLGKRLAKYVLKSTYPDQPFLPVKKPLSRTFTDTFKTEGSKAKRDGLPSHHGSSIHHPSQQKSEDLPYRFTSISFIGHSLGGLIQTYAIAYIHKHSPTFFTQIQPVNFVCMASPMLGLSNENPLYVKFALDFGLVGRTGQDLGLTWRPPTLARGGWNAMIGGLGGGNSQNDQKQEDPSAKPLLRILPTGPAHQVLRMFRNRTVYSNVVNDGIVPLRTGCLLFLDWRGLGKVDKARRENGLIGTVAEWGWAELTGANLSAVPASIMQDGSDDEDSENEQVRRGEGETVPQPAEDETADDNKKPTNRMSFTEDEPRSRQGSSASMIKQGSPGQKSILDNFLDFFRPATPQRSKSPVPTSKKTDRALSRGQTIQAGENELSNEISEGREGTPSNPIMRPHLSEHGNQTDRKRPKATRGDSIINAEGGGLQAPPKTSIFESAGDILHPPLPSRRWITDPATRARTIFHDRVYHPEDIPPPPMKQSSSRRTRSFSSDAASKGSQSSGLSMDSRSSAESGGMKVEEKIARAYHRDLSWRKVLVRLEPDAHNNMIVRRMFANAYGWPVVKHLCDTHFADTFAANTRDEEEPARERAQPMDAPLPDTGEEVRDQTAKQVPERTRSETREARDELADLRAIRDGTSDSYSSNKPRPDRQNSAVWDDAFFEGSDGDDSDQDDRNLVQRLINPRPLQLPERAHHRPSQPSQHDGAPRSPKSPTYTDGHRGLAPISPASAKGHGSAKSAASPMPKADTAEVEPPVITGELVSEPESLEGQKDQTSGSITDVGLRKPIAEQVSPASKQKRDRPGSSYA